MSRRCRTRATLDNCLRYEPPNYLHLRLDHDAEFYVVAYAEHYHYQRLFHSLEACALTRLPNFSGSLTDTCLFVQTLAWEVTAVGPERRIVAIATWILDRRAQGSRMLESGMGIHRRDENEKYEDDGAFHRQHVSSRRRSSQ